MSLKESTAKPTTVVVDHDHTLLLLRGHHDAAGKKRFSLFHVCENITIVHNEHLPTNDADVWTMAERITSRGCLASLAILWNSCDKEIGREVVACLTTVGIRATGESITDVLPIGDYSAPLRVDVLAKPMDEAFDVCNASFRTLWWHIAIASSKFSRPMRTPVETLLYYLVPHAAVRIVHVAQVGPNAICVALFDPMSKTESVARGTLVDVLQKLSALPANTIFVPTYLSKRQVLLALRHALQLGGKRPVVVFPTDISERTGASISSRVSDYWESLRGDVQDMEAVMQIRQAAGRILRKTQEVVIATGSKSVEKARKSAEDGTAASSVLPNAVVTEWLRPLSLQERCHEEKRMAATLNKSPLFISWCATNFAVNGRPENPVAHVNRILAMHLTDASGMSWTTPFLYDTRNDVSLASLDNYDVLVLHNAKHFLVLMHDDAELQKFLQRGGRVWCTLTAEYFLSSTCFRTQNLGVGDIASRYGAPAADTRGAFSFNCCSFTEGYSAVLAHLHASAASLSVVFAEQVALGVHRSQLLSIAGRMEALLAFSDMEYRGIHVDFATSRELLKREKNELIEVQDALSVYLPRNFPVDCLRQFDWTNRHHLKAFFLGGSIPIGGLENSNVRPLGWIRNWLRFAHAHNILRSMPSEHPLIRRFAQSIAPEDGRAESAIEIVAAYFDKTIVSGKPAAPPAAPQGIPEGSLPQASSFRVVVFDLESTGLNLMTDEILELGFWDPIEGTEFSSIVNPNRIIPGETIAIHKITNEMAAAGPPTEVVVKNLAEYLRITPRTKNAGETLILLAHNAFALDEPLLRRTLSHHCPDCSIDDVLFCDSVSILKALRLRSAASSISPRIRQVLLTSLKLGKMQELLQLPTHGELHRAINDAKLLWSILREVVGIPRDAPPKRVRDSLVQLMCHAISGAPESHCFHVPRPSSAVVTLPGRLNATKRRRELRSRVGKQLSSSHLHDALDALIQGGVKEAVLIKRKITLETNPLSLLQENDSGTALLVQHEVDGCIHPLIDMTATSTSRTTSSFPSGHTVPKAGKSQLRRMFASRFGSKGYCVEIDYSQLEIAVMAILCKDPTLLAQLKSGIDFHTVRAAQFSGKSYDEIAAGCKAGIPEFVQLRQKAKEFSFQRLYGAGAHLIHKTTKLSLNQIYSSIRSEEKLYPMMRHFYKTVRSVALRPENPGLPSHFHFELPTGLRVAFTPRDCIHNLPPLKNYPVQGYGAELVQFALGRVYRHFLSQRFFENRAFLTNFVHDSVWLDVHEDVADEAIAAAENILSSVSSIVENAIPSVTIPLDFKCSVSKGRNLYEMTPHRPASTMEMKQHKS